MVIQPDAAGTLAQVLPVFMLTYAFPNSPTVRGVHFIVRSINHLVVGTVMQWLLGLFFVCVPLFGESMFLLSVVRDVPLTGRVAYWASMCGVVMPISMAFGVFIHMLNPEPKPQLPKGGSSPVDKSKF